MKRISLMVAILFFVLSSGLTAQGQRLDRNLKNLTVPERASIDKIEKSEPAAAFDVTVSGTVTDANGEPIPGATVSVPGTSIGTATDLDGKYSLTVPDGASLVFSFIGFESQTVEVGNRQTINISLVESTANLDEVVVVGYGTQQKVNLTGAVGVATSERLEGRPIANVAEGLQGVIPNLNIAPRNGDPSQSPSFNIRGFQSINGGSPLVLVDNVPMDLNRVNPNDIESVSVLKDAAAAAVYGARAAFGVI
ncbi:carboxypeptidase-like regulatory domain-containing protein, partial [Cyclobacterium xiamenense]|uniref:carboxypeptidase-like regulatory domain-containing protein n=1 Tax=Cyclobacterium xiamenense TaxID=1297121 RepID=UPI001F513CCC